LAHAFLCEYGYKRLKLAQLLGRLGIFLSHLQADEDRPAVVAQLDWSAIRERRRVWASTAQRAVRALAEELRWQAAQIELRCAAPAEVKRHQGRLPRPKRVVPRVISDCHASEGRSENK
jgi:hypothetical protein